MFEHNACREGAKPFLNETWAERLNRWESEGRKVRLATTRLLFAHWDRLRGERAAPTRGDIDPAHLRSFLADVFMLDAKPWQEGRIRLAGTRVCALFGHELKGQRLPELWFECERAEISRLIGAVTGGMHGLVASLTGRPRRAVSSTSSCSCCPCVRTQPPNAAPSAPSPPSICRRGSASTRSPR